ncbi:MAG: GTPase HflX [Cyclobacteriaceae bacterium]|jgi:GTP-binding protein HflX|nr:GTPase HflX [Cytophagales bacterium]MCZ8329386.1 GTPase HflX [Cyclobacteriaceae bacterium]
MNKKQTIAILIALGDSRQLDLVNEHLDELAFLAETAGIKTAKRVVQNLPKPDGKFFIGKGKVEEVKEYIAALQADHIIFDDDLSPSQLRNLEKEFNPKEKESKVRIYDRSLLILDIFSLRAQTAQARTQVDLARLQYLLPRLTRMWTHLERQRGGTGTRGGAGEREIETDRRIIRDQINLLKEKLKKIESHQATQRKARTGMVRVAIAGYTNAGKSTLMNLLSGSTVLAENKLFATVDATVRKVSMGTIPFLLSDTVGFIRKLPHHLIESFKSTLDEVREADVILHVADVSHPYHENHIEVVSKTLVEIGAGHIPVVLVLNKVDTVIKENPDFDFDKATGYYKQFGFEKIIFISATKKINLQAFRQLVWQEVKNHFLRIYPNYTLPDYELLPPAEQQALPKQEE